MGRGARDEGSTGGLAESVAGKKTVGGRKGIGDDGMVATLATSLAARRRGLEEGEGWPGMDTGRVDATEAHRDGDKEPVGDDPRWTGGEER